MKKLHSYSREDGFLMFQTKKGFVCVPSNEVEIKFKKKNAFKGNTLEEAFDKFVGSIKEV